MGLGTILDIRPGTTGEQVRSMLRAVRRHLGMEVGFVSEFQDGNRVFRYVDGDTQRAPISVGAFDPLEESFCHYIAKGMMPQLMHDAASNPIAGGMSVTRALPIGAHISAPLQHADGTPFGTLCCFSFTPDHSLTERDLGVLRLCAELVSAVLGKDRHATLDLETRRSRIAEVLTARAIAMVYQPIYRVADRRLTGFEALARFPTDPSRPIETWFADAEKVGLAQSLEFLAAEKALEALPRLDPTVKVTINLSPASVIGPHFATALAKAPLDRVVIELTEHAVIDCYETLRTALAPLRAQGLRIAIDDVGAGHSTFRHVLDLSPELIKLDRSLIHQIDKDSARRALAEALTTYGRRIGCEVVAEGVETPAEYDVLEDIGVTRAQGYLTGRPMSLEQAAELPLQGHRIFIEPDRDRAARA